MTVEYKMDCEYAHKTHSINVKSKNRGIQNWKANHIPTEGLVEFCLTMGCSLIHPKKGDIHIPIKALQFVFSR